MILCHQDTLEVLCFLPGILMLVIVVQQLVCLVSQSLLGVFMAKFATHRPLLDVTHERNDFAHFHWTSFSAHLILFWTWTDATCPEHN